MEFFNGMKKEMLCSLWRFSSSFKYFLRMFLREILCLMVNEIKKSRFITGFFYLKTMLCVGLPGFEPRQTEPKPVVLPLHHSPNIMKLSLESDAKITHLIDNFQIIFCFFSLQCMMTAFFLLFGYYQIIIFLSSLY